MRAITRAAAGILGLLCCQLPTLAGEAEGGSVPRPPDTSPAAEEAAEEAAEITGLTGNWFGLRTDLARKGITVEPSITLDWYHNLRGGRNTENFGGIYLVDLEFNIETEPLFGWKGGTLYGDLQKYGGRNAFVDTGDFQFTSSLDAPQFYIQLSELWYEQRFADDKLAVKFGKVDANGDFAFAEYSLEFVHGTLNYAFPATNLLMPTYPDPSTAVILFAEPVDWFYARAGVFDGALHEGVRTGGTGPATFWGDPADLYLIGEAGLRWKTGEDERQGRLGLGVWRHTGDFDAFDGGRQDGATGFYAILNQTLWKENPKDEEDEQGLGLFVGYNWADPDVMEADHNILFGLLWTGPIPSRDADMIGLGASWLHFSEDAGYDDDSETAFETFYKYQVTDYFSIKADLQYIMNPSDEFPDALQALLRFELAL